MKLRLKRHGADAEKDEANLLLKQIDEQLAHLDPEDKEDKKRMKSLEKDQRVLNERIAHADALMKEIGGQLTAEEAKNLILKKLYDTMQKEMLRYLNAEKRAVISLFENLHIKYARSLEALTASNDTARSDMNLFLAQLGYVGV
jgi:type I restriction enzyme M protein